MANYKQDKVVGWQRSKSVHIDNNYKAVPTIEFKEEFVVEMDGELINKKDVGSVTSSLKDPSVSFNLLNPEDDQVIGTGTYAQVYVLLYSVYRYLADKRDTREALYQAFIPKDTALKTAISAKTTADNFFKAAKDAFDKDTKNATLGQKLSDAMEAQRVAAEALAIAQAEYDTAKAAYEAAGDYL